MVSETGVALKPFRSDGLAHRVTPFVATGLISLVVLVDPGLTHAYADFLALGFALVALVLIATRPFPSRFLVVSALILSLFCVLLPILSSLGTLAVTAFCIAIILAVYLLPWDVLPRVFHASISPLGVLAILALQLLFGTSPLLAFPLFVVIILFAALHYTLKELLITAFIASLALLLPAWDHPAVLALSFLLGVVLWVLALTVHDLVSLLRAARATISRLLGPDFKMLFESTPSLYLVLDPVLNIIAASDAYLHTTMTTREAILGHPLFEVFPDNPNDPTANGVANLRASLNRVRASLLSDTMAIQKYDIRRPDGSFEVRYWSPKNSPVLGSDHHLTSIIHRVEDVTEFALLREQHAASATRADILAARTTQLEIELFQRAQELTVLNRSLETSQKSHTVFFASMNHELRTPLNAVLGFTDSLLSEMPGPLTVEQQNQLATIRTSGRHLLSLINDLLDIARLEQDRWVPSLEPVVISELAANAVNSLRPLAVARSLTMTVEAPDLLFVTDRRALTQILINLLGNAIKFTASGSVSLNVSLTDDALLFAVADTGSGIAPEAANQLFAAFERLAGGATTAEGTGLGLYFSQRLANLLAGEITFVSTLNVGSIFTLRLPYPAPLAHPQFSLPPI